MKNNLIASVAMLAGCAAFALLPAQEPTAVGVKLKAGKSAAPVTASPYSAVAVTENVQTLADGNRIVQNHSEKLYRDGQGRERSETAQGADGFTAVIRDPVAKTGYNLNSRSRTARQTPATAFAFQVYERPAREAEQAARLAEVNAKLAEMNAKLAEADARLAEADAQRSAAAALAAGAAGRGGAAGAAGVAGSVVPGGRGGRGPGPAGQNIVKEDLPAQNIEGVYATGTRTTRTIPPGQIGNEKPIQIVEEVWYSPDLQMTVLTKHSDPRMGENTYRLTNISRAEPDPSLFQVPPGYTIVGARK